MAGRDAMRLVGAGLSPESSLLPHTLGDRGE